MQYLRVSEGRAAVKGNVMSRTGKKKAGGTDGSLRDEITADAVVVIAAVNRRLRERVLSAFAVYDAELSRLFDPTREIVGWVLRDDGDGEYYGADGWEETRSRVVPFSSPAAAREALAEFFRSCDADPEPATLVRVWRKKKKGEAAR